MNILHNTHRAIRLTGATAALLLSQFLSADIAHAASADANASAVVVAPISITNTGDISFGKFAAGTGGTVVMSPAGSRSKSGGVVLLTGSAGYAAHFSVTGDSGATYAITLPSSATVTHTDGETTMDIGTFTSSPSSPGTLTSGTQNLLVGATLTVASSQLAGVYAGSFSVSVEYN